jgi:hypothetical protein
MTEWMTPKFPRAFGDYVDTSHGKNDNNFEEGVPKVGGLTAFEVDLMIFRRNFWNSVALKKVEKSFSESFQSFK